MPSKFDRYKNNLSFDIEFLSELKILNNSFTSIYVSFLHERYISPKERFSSYPEFIK